MNVPPAACTHEVTELRRFTQSNGTTHFTLQCQNPACLKRPNDLFVARAKLLATMDDAEIDAIPAFDHCGRERNKKTLREDRQCARVVMTRSEYRVYLESDHWKKTRSRIMKRAGYKLVLEVNTSAAVVLWQWCEGGPPGEVFGFYETQAKCEECGKRAAKVVHHLTYEHLGAELDEDLVAICRWCHRKHHPDMPLRDGSPSRSR